MIEFVKMIVGRFHAAGRYSLLALPFIVLISLGGYLAARWVKTYAPANIREIATTILIVFVAIGAFAVLSFGPALVVCVILLSCHAAGILKRRGLFPHVE